MTSLGRHVRMLVLILICMEREDSYQYYGTNLMYLFCFFNFQVHSGVVTTSLIKTCYKTRLVRTRDKTVSDIRYRSPSRKKITEI